MALTSISLWAQNPEDEWNNLSEFLVHPETGVSADLQQWMDRLDELRQHPIPINEAQLEDLLQVPILDAIEAFMILEHRRKFGPFLSVYDLLSIEGLPAGKVKLLAKVLHCAPPVRRGWKQAQPWRGGQHVLVLRGSGITEPLSGLQGHQPTYPGLPAAMFGRYRYVLRNRLSIGITAENDVGEPYRGVGPDFISGHVAFSGQKTIKTLVVGDFHANFGQGLVLFTFPAMGKGAEFNGLMRQERPIAAFTGRNEFYFLRGAAATLQHQSWELTVLGSTRKLDARIGSDDESFQLIEDGLHRTPDELLRKGAYTWNVAALRLNKTHGHHLQWGVSAAANHGSGQINAGNLAYQRYRNLPQQWINTGVDVRWRMRKSVLFGELAYSSNGGMSGLAGMTYKPASHWTLSALYRHLGLEYKALMTHPFSHSGHPGESGLFLSLQGELSSQWMIVAFVDHYQYQWLTYRTDVPWWGRDWMIQPVWSPTPGTKVYFRYRYTQGMDNEPGTSAGVPAPSTRTNHGFRVHVAGTWQGPWTYATRAEVNLFNNPTGQSTGWMIFQDIQWKQGRWQVAGRLALVQAPSFNNRMFAYERDVPLMFTVPAYFGEGVRGYINAAFQLTSKVRLGLRAARWTKPGVLTQGSGPEATAGMHRTELRGQVMIQW